MHYLKRMIQKKDEDAVSPVVGVMLMLVVTIIIAAVVSGFAGGLVNGQSKSPTLSADVKIVNTGTYVGSGFSANIVGVSQPIASKNVKIVTSWSTTMKNHNSADLTSTQAAIANGAIFTGGAIVTPNIGTITVLPSGVTVGSGVASAPFGVGADISGSSLTDPYDNSSSYFGQYTLQQGVGLFANAYGSANLEAVAGAAGLADGSGYNGKTPYIYTTGTGNYAAGNVDGAIAVLGTGWEQLRAGDTVHVAVIYTPTGATIYSKDVAVTEG
jgi:FlaG/FlaF family flagellin (archaellin)